MPVTPPTTPPPGLPILEVGSHRSPADGACVMEYVSLLAGEPWSDRPWCTQPLLAAVARCVNDRVSPSTRGELGLLATELAGATRRDPTACAAVIDAIITAAARYVAVPEAARQIRDRALERSMTHTASRLRRSWWSATRCDFTRAAERSLCGVVVQVARTADDAALLDLLRSGLAGYRAPARPAVGYSPVAPSASSRATSS